MSDRPVPRTHPTRTRHLRALAAVAALGMVAGLIIVADDAPVRAATSRTTVQAAADTYIDRARPHRNFGSRKSLRVDSRPSQAMLLRFSVPQTALPVTRATLQVLVSGSSSAGLAVRTNGARWKESRVTWAKAPGSGRRLDSVTWVRARRWVSLDVTAAVVAGRDLNLRLTTPGTRRVPIWAREAGAARAPRLVLESGSLGAPSPGPVGSPAPPTIPPPPSPVVPPPVVGPAPVIAAAGDIACDPSSGNFQGGAGTVDGCAERATSDLMLGMPDLTAVLALGDIQYEDGSLAKFRSSYDPSWGRLRAITRPAVGNHEYLTRGAAGYFDYFGAAAGERGKGYYSYDLGAWHVVALNSNCSQAGGCGPGSPQLEWLQADLTAHPNRCTLAYWHHPVFSSGDHGNIPGAIPLWDALTAAGADVVLTGHDHIYERYAPQTSSGAADPRGIREFVVGTGGRNHTFIRTVRPNSEVRNDDTFGVLRMTLHPEGYDWEFRPVPGGSFRDSGTAACH
jgi:hypothetical protein